MEAGKQAWHCTTCVDNLTLTLKFERRPRNQCNKLEGVRKRSSWLSCCERAPPCAATAAVTGTARPHWPGGVSCTWCFWGPKVCSPFSGPSLTWNKSQITGLLCFLKCYYFNWKKWCLYDSETPAPDSSLYNLLLYAWLESQCMHKLLI